MKILVMEPKNLHLNGFMGPKLSSAEILCFTTHKKNGSWDLPLYHTKYNNLCILTTSTYIMIAHCVTMAYAQKLQASHLQFKLRILNIKLAWNKFNLISNSRRRLKMNVGSHQDLTSKWWNKMTYYEHFKKQ